MRQFLVVLFFVLFSVSSNGQIQDDNIYNQTEKDESTLLQSPEVGTNGNGNPGEPVPIDSYIPILILISIGIIAYSTYKKKSIN